MINQKLTFGENKALEQVEVFNKDNLSQIKFTITSLDTVSTIEEEFFALANNVQEIQEEPKSENAEDPNTNTEDSDTNAEDPNTETSILDNIVYPMYIPAGASFEREEKLNNGDSERVILTFGGEKPFIMVEEVSNIPEEFEINTADGDLVFYENILGSITDTSLTWHANGMEYYIIAENLTSDEILQIASSTKAVAVVK